MFFGVVGFVLGVDFDVVAWDVVMVFGVVGFVLGVDFVDGKKMTFLSYLLLRRHSEL